jgi:cation diffusion facilitator family transporter
MPSCCEDKSCEVAALRESHARVLWIVLALNAAMFVVEAYYGFAARSTSLLADSLDMLGDALVYGFSLFVLAKSARWQAGAAVAKGLFMLTFGVAVLAEAIYKAIVPALPTAETMGIVGGVALAANAACFGLLYRLRSDNLNMRSTWLCSRNDLLANLGVIAAAAATYAMSSRWPDIFVGGVIAVLFLWSAGSILIEAVAALRHPPRRRPELVQLDLS